MNLLLDTALAYADAGWPVFPCRPNGKAPVGRLARNGVKDATTDPGRITAWWSEVPQANIAVACGAPGPDVLDVDTKSDLPGAELFEKARLAGLAAGAAAIIRTPSGGLHVWFEGTDQPGGAVGKGRALELKASGGYVLLPPSYVIDAEKGYEGPYELIESRDGAGTVDFAAIRRLLDPRPIRPVKPLIPGDVAGRNQRIAGLVRKVESTGEGNRNAVLFWAAKRAAGYGLPDNDGIYDTLISVSVANGLNRKAAADTVESGKKHGRGLVAA